MKKLTSLLLALVLVFSLVACGKSSKKEKPTESNKETKTEQSTENSKLEKANIVFWHAMNGAHEETLTELTKKFMEENPDVKVELQNQTGYRELQQKITATTTSPKDLPTITQAYPDWMLNPIKDGLVNELTSFTKTVEDYEDIVEGFRKGTEINGKVYSMPFNKSTEVLFYNEDIFKELGLEVPKNLDELVKVSKVIKEKKGIPAIGIDSLSNYYTTFLKAQGVEFDNKFDPTSEASKKAVQFYLDGVKEGYFRIAGTDKYLSGPFGNQQVAMYIGSNAGESYVVKGTKGKFTAKAAKSPFSPTIQQGTDLYVFESASDAQKKAAYAYMKFLTKKENQILWAQKTGYIPARNSAINSDEYKNSKSLIAPILSDVTKNLYTNPVLPGANQAYREAGTVLETILASPNSENVDAALNSFKSTLEGIWN